MLVAVVRSFAGVIAIVTSLTTLSLYAAETVEPVVVTATRTTESGDATLSPMIVIDAATIAQNPGADIADILRDYSGIEIGRNGGPGQTTSFFIRGANSNQTLVMIDGVKINPGTLGTPAIQNIDPAIIERIEVVKGPRSTLYGSDAIGGVINIITKRSSQPGATFDAAVGAGSYGTESLKIGATNRSENKAADIQISASKSRGFPTLTASDTDRGYNNLSLNLYGSKKIGDSNIEISHWHVYGKVDYIDNFYSTLLDQNFTNEATALTIKNTPMANWFNTVKISHMVDYLRQNQSTDYAQTQRNTLDWQNDVQLNSSQLLSAGLTVSDEHTTAASYGTYFDEFTTIGAVYLQDKLESPNQKLVIGARLTDNQNFGRNTTWNVEYGYALNKQLKLIAANNSGFRAPDNTDRFGYGGNPDLKPETSVNNEISLRYTPSRQHRLEINVYDNKISELIEPTATINENINQAEIKGIETIYAYTAQQLSLRGSITLQDPHDVTNNEQLARRAKHIYAAYLGYRIDATTLGLNVAYNGERRDSHYSTTMLDSYTLINLTAQYVISKSFTINGRIENLGKADYELASGYRTPGRSAYFELHYKL